MGPNDEEEEVQLLGSLTKATSKQTCLKANITELIQFLSGQTYHILLVDVTYYMW